MRKQLLVLVISLLSSTSFAQWATNGNNLTTDKNVGIGTDNPQSRLHVVGDILSSNYMVSHNHYIGASLSDVFKYKERSMGHYALSWMNDPWSSGGSTLWQSAYSGIKFFTQGQYRMGITTGGNVGIGTDNPQSRLHVVGDILSSNYRFHIITILGHLCLMCSNTKNEVWDTMHYPG